MSVKSDLERDGVAIINDLIDLGTIATLQQTLSQIPIQFFTNGTDTIVPDSPVTFLPWRPICIALMEEFEKVNAPEEDSEKNKRLTA